MSHFMEQYFVKDISPVAEGLIEGILRTVIRNTPVVLENPGDLDADPNFSGRARSAATASLLSALRPRAGPATPSSTR